MAADTPTWRPLSDTQFFILLSLRTGPRPGYAIVSDVAKVMTSNPRLELRSFYRALRELCTAGMVETVECEDSTRARRRTSWYVLTALGRERLEEELGKPH